MNLQIDSYLGLLSKYLAKENQDPREFLPIISEIYESGKEGSLCVPVKKEWNEIIAQNPKAFIFQTINGVEHVYFEKVYTSKARLERALKKQINENKTINVEAKKIDPILKDLEARFSRNLQREFQLNEGQKNAIKHSLASNFQIISGGPGTGKTTVVAFLLLLMKELNLLPDPSEIALVAPTGRAAQRLTESIQANLRTMSSPEDFNELFHGQTVHSLLSFRRNEARFYYNKDRSLPYRFILIDEVSMMDLELMVSLFDALENVSKDEGFPFHLILLGDPNQLPSVDKGEVLADFLSELPERGNFISHLTKSNRLSENSNRFQLMKSIFPDLPLSEWNKDLKLPEIKEATSLSEAKSSNEDLLWLNVQNVSESNSLHDLFINELWEFHFLPMIKSIHSWNLQSLDSLKSHPIAVFNTELNRFRCLTIFRQGFYGIEGIHGKISMLAEKFFKRQDSTSKIHFRTLALRMYFEGMPIIITKNDKSRKLFNGDVGFICRIDTELRAIFCINNSLFSFAIDTLPDHEPAFFMTVHKSQGSEYDNVLFYLPPMLETSSNQDENANAHRLLNRKILYTAITRAKEKVILVGERKTWEIGLANNPSRITGFNLKEIN
jgi:exodeoxyribonuclease V alpha subunit